MNNLEKLTADIRNKIPRLMELTEGCEYRYEDQTYKVDGIYRKFQNGYLSVGGEILFRDEYDIIGHDPMLNDVLEWLGLNYSYNFFIDSIGQICNYNQGLSGWIIKGKWELKSPYLKDQSSDLIDYLVALIK